MCAAGQTGILGGPSSAFDQCMQQELVVRLARCAGMCATRLPTAFAVLQLSSFSMQEKMFVAMTWIPKVRLADSRDLCADVCSAASAQPSAGCPAPSATGFGRPASKASWFCSCILVRFTAVKGPLISDQAVCLSGLIITLQQSLSAWLLACKA